MTHWMIGFLVLFAAVAFAATPVSAADLEITTDSALPNGTQDNPYGLFYFEATGGTGGYTWSVLSGTLPSGVDFYDWDQERGMIWGYPYQTGTFEFVAQVQDSASAVATKSFSFTIAPPIVVEPDIYLPNATVGVPYSYTLHVSGGNPGFTWSVTGGSLPDGLSLNPATGEISGTPIQETTMAANCMATDSTGATGSGLIMITVVPQ